MILSSNNLLLPFLRQISQIPFYPRRKKSAFLYAKDLTEFPPKSTSADIQKMREEGFSDEEILEINQVTSYFSYVNRTVIGLGCSLEKTDENE